MRMLDGQHCEACRAWNLEQLRRGHLSWVKCRAPSVFTLNYTTDGSVAGAQRYTCTDAPRSTSTCRPSARRAARGGAEPGAGRRRTHAHTAP